MRLPPWRSALPTYALHEAGLMRVITISAFSGLCTCVHHHWCCGCKAAVRQCFQHIKLILIATTLNSSKRVILLAVWADSAAQHSFEAVL